MGLDEAAIAEIETEISGSLDAHPVVRGLRGARKARFPIPGRRKSRGGRAIYFIAVASDILFMMTAYPKNDRADLSSEQRRAILEALASIEGGEW